MSNQLGKFHGDISKLKLLPLFTCSASPILALSLVYQPMTDCCNTRLQIFYGCAKLHLHQLFKTFIMTSFFSLAGDIYIHHGSCLNFSQDTSTTIKSIWSSSRCLRCNTGQVVDHSVLANLAKSANSSATPVPLLSTSSYLK